MCMVKSNNFIERSIIGALSFLKESILSDECASREAFLQSLDPRVKVVTFIIFILTALFAKNIFTALYLYLICLALAWLSKISLGFFLKRTWIFIPLFSFSAVAWVLSL